MDRKVVLEISIFENLCGLSRQSDAKRLMIFVVASIAGGLMARQNDSGG